MNYFKNCNTVQELKSMYRKLSKEYHPDNQMTGSLEKMKEINAEYESLYKRLELERIKEKQKQNPNYKTKTDEDLNKDISKFYEILNTLRKYEDIEIEIIGVWVWVGGNTKPIKSILKDLGFIWHNKKKLWSYAEPQDRIKSKSYREYSIEEIRSKYGSTKIKNYKNEEKKAITG